MVSTKDNAMVKIFEKYSTSTRVRKLCKSEDKKDRHAPFDTIFTVIMLLGMCVSPSAMQRKSKKLNIFIKVWSILVISFTTVCMFFFCLYCPMLLPSIATRIATYIFNISAVFNYLYFIKNRKKIVNAVKKVSYMKTELDSKAIEKNSRIKLHLFLALLSCIMITLISIKFFFYVQWDNHYERFKLLAPFMKDDPFLYQFIWLNVFSFTYSYSMCWAISYVMLFLCSSAYNSTSQLFVSFENHIKRTLALSHVPIHQNATIFKNIIISAKDIDKSFRICSFSIYVCMVSTLFNTIGVVLLDTQAFRHFAVITYLFSVSMFSLTAIFVLTFSGAKISEECDSLKEKLVELSSKVIRESPDVYTILMFNLLFENIKSSKCYATALGLFRMTKRFILSIVGMLITYGVMIYQVGITKDL